MSNTRKKLEINLSQIDPQHNAPLFSLPNEMLVKITTEFTERDKANLIQSSRFAYSIFHPDFEKKAAKKCLEYVLQAKKDQVLKMAQSNPSLFFIKSTAHDYASDLQGTKRIIKDWSPYQALYGTGDADMLLAVKPYLDVYLEGSNLGVKQLQEKFPHGLLIPPSQYDFDFLVAAITNDERLRHGDNLSDATREALTKFKNDFKPGDVERGYHFNMNDFIQANEIYVRNWKRWRSGQLTCFTVHVIGFMERMLPSHYLQAICQGLYYHFGEFKNQEFSRRFGIMRTGLRKKEMLIAVPLDADPLEKLGEHFSVDTYYGLTPWLLGVDLLRANVLSAFVDEHSKVIERCARSRLCVESRSMHDV